MTFDYRTKIKMTMFSRENGTHLWHWNRQHWENKHECMNVWEISDFNEQLYILKVTKIEINVIQESRISLLLQ